MTTNILTVTELNRQVRSWLEHEIGTVHVQGELSNVTQPTSGHLYFTLKDKSAQIRAVYFRNRHRKSITPQNGQQVILHGTLSLYEPRGDYQLIVEYMEEVGHGDLFRQFELLKAKLQALGWFEMSQKKPLPPFPKVIGVITSPSGAAFHDICTTLARRYPVAQVILFSSDVQGQLAVPQLIKALHKANEHPKVEVIILARGGGSLEDLWAFNDEQLALEIRKSQIPIISGVGHETDVTIADFVADVRAATPTAAAVAASPDKEELLAIFKAYENQLLYLMHRMLQHFKLLLQHELQKITSPKQLILSRWQSLDNLSLQLRGLIEQLFLQHQSSFKQSKEALLFQAKTLLSKPQEQFRTLLATLNAVSPLATLERGYAIATHNEKVLHDTTDLKEGDIIDVRLAFGALRSKITEFFQV